MTKDALVTLYFVYMPHKCNVPSLSPVEDPCCMSHPLSLPMFPIYRYLIMAEMLKIVLKINNKSCLKQLNNQLNAKAPPSLAKKGSNKFEIYKCISFVSPFSLRSRVMNFLGGITPTFLFWLAIL